LILPARPLKKGQRFAGNRRKRLEQEESDAPHAEKLAMLQPSIIKRAIARCA
jgi:hypothetical protein